MTSLLTPRRSPRRRPRRSDRPEAAIPTDDAIRTLIVDDDALARKRLRQVLDEQEDIEILGECADGESAVKEIRERDLDLVILDVQMPGLDGLSVVAEVGVDAMPAIIFVSAFGEFAVRAFEAYALDYVLKPYDDARMRDALDRAREQVRQEPLAVDPRLEALLQFMAEKKTEYPAVLAIKSGDRYPLLDVATIDYISAEGNYARIHVGEDSRLINKSLTELETNVLDPARFLRIHRSTIVNLDRIVAVEPLFHGEYSVELRDGTTLTCSRRHKHKLQDRIYFTS